MTYHEAVRLKAVTQQQESFFFIGMIRIVDQARILIEKNSLSFLKGDAMLGKVRSGLPAIPGKFDIAHSLILAISGAARNPPPEMPHAAMCCIRPKKCGLDIRRLQAHIVVADPIHLLWVPILQSGGTNIQGGSS